MAQKTDIQYIRLYTDGSAARKIQPVAPWKTARLPKINKQKKIVIHIDPLAVAGIVTAVIMLTLMFVGVGQLQQVQQETAVMEAYVESLRTDNVQLYDTYESGYDLEEIQRMAVALGMIPKDQAQQVYVDVAAPVAEQQPAPSVWESVWTFLTGLFA